MITRESKPWTIPLLILAACQSRLGNLVAAHEYLKQAEALWPEQLKSADHLATYTEAILWIESAQVWNGLRNEVATALVEPPSKE